MSTSPRYTYELRADFDPKARSVTIFLDADGFRYAEQNKAHSIGGTAISSRELGRAVKDTVDNNVRRSHR